MPWNVSRSRIPPGPTRRPRQAASARPACRKRPHRRSRARGACGTRCALRSPQPAARRRRACPSPPGSDRRCQGRMVAIGRVARRSSNPARTPVGRGRPRVRRRARRSWLGPEGTDAAGSGRLRRTRPGCLEQGKSPGPGMPASFSQGPPRKPRGPPPRGSRRGRGPIRGGVILDGTDHCNRTSERVRQVGQRRRPMIPGARRPAAVRRPVSPRPRPS